MPPPRAGYTVRGGAWIMGPLCEIGPDGEIFDDGSIYIPFPMDPDLDMADPLDG